MKINKKIILILLLCIVILMPSMLSGCTNNTETTAQGQSNNDDTQKSEVKKNASEVIAVKLGETITVPDYCEFTISDTKFAKRIDPPKPASFYTYYEIKEAGNIYLDTLISFKSLLSSGKNADGFASVKIKYNNKYEYKTFSTIEEDGGSNFGYTNITSIEPLKNGILHYLAEVPEEVENSSNPLYAEIIVNGKVYRYDIR